MPLAPKRATFVREYVVDHNGKQAAIRAGYAAGSAKVTASRLLTDTNVRAAIAAFEARAVARTEWDVARIVARAGEVALQDKPDRVAALALLARRHSEFRDSALVDQSQHLHLPPGTTLDDVRALVQQLRALPDG